MTSMAAESVATILCTAKQTRFNIDSTNYREVRQICKYGIIYTSKRWKLTNELARHWRPQHCRHFWRESRQAWKGCWQVQRQIKIRWAWDPVQRQAAIERRAALCLDWPQWNGKVEWGFSLPCLAKDDRLTRNCTLDHCSTAQGYCSKAHSRNSRGLQDRNSAADKAYRIWRRWQDGKG